MIAIVDSGGTKSLWSFIEEGKEIQRVTAPGLNPYYLNSGEIAITLKQHILPKIDLDKLTNIYFYGAGCEPQEKKTIIHQVFSELFQSHIEVQHDLLAAGRALFGNEKGIACISGTGSNSGFYDGETISKNISSLGLYLGDEGSGGYFGKLLLQAYLRKQLHFEIEDHFESEFSFRGNEIMNSIYNANQPSKFIASFFPFVYKHKDNDFIKSLIHKGFNDLFKNCINYYDQSNYLPISFIGSVANLLEDDLKYIANKNHKEIGITLKEPMDQLIEFHLKN